MAMAMAMAMATVMATATMRNSRLAGRVRNPNTQRVANALAVILLGNAGATFAANWNFESDLSDQTDLRYVWVDRDGADGGDGSVIQFSPGFTLDRAGGRARVDITYRPTVSFGFSDTDPETLTHSLRARGEVEAVERLLFIDANAAAAVVGDRSTSGSVDAINAGTDGSQSYSFQVSPSLRPESNNRFVRFESNNSINLVDYTGGSDRSSSSGSNETVLNATLLSGPFFSTYNWDVRATRRATDFDDRDDTRREYSAGVGYEVTSQILLNARAGYEDNDVETREDDTDGVIWNAGATWIISPRTSLSANYGDRYFGNTYSGRISHRSRRTTLTLDATRDIENRRNSRLLDNFFFLVDENGDVLIDPITGQPIIINIPNLEETDEDFISTRLRGGVSLSGRRTNVSLTADVENREFEVSGDEADTYRVSVNASRRIAGNITASMNGQYETVDDFDGGDTDSYLVRLSLSKELSSRTTISLDASYQDRDAADNDDDFNETRVGITLSTSFFD